MRQSTTSYPAKPFVKWVGGKGQLLDEIKQALPADLAARKELHYVEPFVGGGAVLFWLLQEYPNITKAVINDVNENLICTYRVIRDSPDRLIETLDTLQTEYLSLNDAERKEYFLAKRAQFNAETKSAVETAALFIFLNRTCFNGLYRVNSRGKFNVPYGKYANPKICDRDTLLADSNLLQKVEILCGDFSDTAKYAGENTLYYFDPPYRPISVSSSFTSYTTGGFSDSEQARLRNFCNEVTKRNALFIASNSDPMNGETRDLFFDELYKNFIIKRVQASRMINSKADKRGSISEILISNIYEQSL